jgi:hypothetical protein
MAWVFSFFPKKTTTVINDQNYIDKSKAQSFSGQKRGLSRAFWVESYQKTMNYVSVFVNVLVCVLALGS